MATATQTFTTSGTWTAPAGVTSVLVTPTYQTFEQFSGKGAIFIFNSTNGLTYGYGQGGTQGAFGTGVSGNVVLSPASVIYQGIQAYKLFGGGTDGTAQVPTFIKAKNGVTYACGYNVEGCLGVGDTVSRSTPTAVLGGLDFKEIKSAYMSPVTERSTTLGLTNDGILYAWGSNNNGQLGDGTTTARTSPVRVLGGYKFAKIEILSAGSALGGAAMFCYGLTTTGQIYAWGGNANGELGVGDAIPRSSPTLVVGGQTWIDFSAACNNSSVTCFALNTSNTPYSWGVNDNGSRGDGGAVFKTSSPGIISGGHTFIKIAASKVGNSSVYGLKSNGQVWSWGINTFGQLAVGDVTSRQTPTQILGGLNIVDVNNLNGNNVFFLTSTNQLYAAGVNTFYGELGVGDNASRSSPTLVLGGITWKTIINAGSYPKGVSTNGSIYAWGIVDTTLLGRSSPVLMAGVTLKTEVESFGPMPSSRRITVVPNTTYSITFNDEFSTFGTTPIASGTISALTIEYEQ